MRWGLLATGSIAEQMALALPHVPGARLGAVGSRSLASAKRFAARHGVPRAHGDYQSLVNDKTIDAVYIATPHHAHHEWTLAALRAGKHVLCEKPMALREMDARESADLARDNSLFLMEAVWTRFLPAIVALKAALDGGVIGAPRLLTAAFCTEFAFDPAHRLFDPALGGGALLDLGLYPLTMAQHLLGEPSEVASVAHLGQTGVDEAASVSLAYASGAMARLAFGSRFEASIALEIVGTKGRITIPERFVAADGFVLERAGAAPEHVSVPMLGNGYAHEVMEVERCVAAGLTQSPIMPLGDTLATMALMDGLRTEWGVRYPGDA